MALVCKWGEKNFESQLIIQPELITEIADLLFMLLFKLWQAAY